MGIIANIRSSIREVNHRYAKPEIETTAFTRVCLVSLRVYLTVMVVLMLYALVHTARTGGEAVQQQVPAAAATQSATPAASP